jgi:hypothetical protein
MGLKIGGQTAEKGHILNRAWEDISPSTKKLLDWVEESLNTASKASRKKR